MVQSVLRIAMWSGPRAMSTALMRAFDSRSDTAVIDEPFYGYYLARSGQTRPHKTEIVRSMPSDWRVIIDQICSAPVDSQKTIQYQKHMTQHLLPEVNKESLGALRHAFLIRHPRLQIASYARMRPNLTLHDLGLRQQVDLFRDFSGPVIDASDILRNPRAALSALCAALGIPFDMAMLSWRPGARATDGVWAGYWYNEVRSSSAFRRYIDPEAVPVPNGLEQLLADCMPFYEKMAQHRLVI